MLFVHLISPSDDHLVLNVLAFLESLRRKTGGVVLARGQRVETHEHAVLPGDCHLLCSDGLTDMVPDAEIAEILSQPWPPSQLAAALVARANERGGRDNVSVLLAQAAPGDPPLHLPEPN